MYCRCNIQGWGRNNWHFPATATANPLHWHGPHLTHSECIRHLVCYVCASHIIHPRKSQLLTLTSMRGRSACNLTRSPCSTFSHDAFFTAGPKTETSRQPQSFSGHRIPARFWALRVSVYERENHQQSQAIKSRVRKRFRTSEETPNRLSFRYQSN